MERTIASIAKWTNPIWWAYLIIAIVCELVWKDWNPITRWWHFYEFKSTASKGWDEKKLKYMERWIESYPTLKYKRFYRKVKEIVENARKEFEEKKTEQFKANVDRQINDMSESVASDGN